MRSLQRSTSRRAPSRHHAMSQKRPLRPGRTAPSPQSEASLAGLCRATGPREDHRWIRVQRPKGAPHDTDRPPPVSTAPAQPSLTGKPCAMTTAGSQPRQPNSTPLAKPGAKTTANPEPRQPHIAPLPNRARIPSAALNRADEPSHLAKWTLSLTAPRPAQGPRDLNRRDAEKESHQPEAA